jgi:hypothetical protein
MFMQVNDSYLEINIVDHLIEFVLTEDYILWAKGFTYFNFQWDIILGDGECGTFEF